MVLRCQEIHLPALLIRAKPHFDAINIGGGQHFATDARPSSEILFQPRLRAGLLRMQVKKVVALEKWDATMAMLAGGQTKDAIRWRQIKIVQMH